MADVIREAFRKSGLSILALSRQAGTRYSATHRFIHGGGLTLEYADRFCRVLGLELRPMRRRKAK